MIDGKTDMSYLYKLGYKIGFKTAILAVRKYIDDAELIEKLIADYNKHPLISKIDSKELIDGK